MKPTLTYTSLLTTRDYQSTPVHCRIYPTDGAQALQSSNIVSEYFADRGVGCSFAALFGGEGGAGGIGDVASGGGMGEGGMAGAGDGRIH